MEAWRNGGISDDPQPGKVDYSTITTPASSGPRALLLPRSRKTSGRLLLDTRKVSRHPAERRARRLANQKFRRPIDAPGTGRKGERQHENPGADHCLREPKGTSDDDIRRDRVCLA